jgi:Sec-independent protein translocase protein TatA
VFGVGPQEVVIIVGLVLVIFGPAKAAGIARDLGRWVNEARRPVEELKEELASSVAEYKDEDRPSAREKQKTKAAVGKDQDDEP